MRNGIINGSLFAGMALLMATGAFAQVTPASGVSGANGAQSLLFFDVKVYPEGVYTGSTPALDSLISGQVYFPTTQPYGGAGFVGTPMHYQGSEAISGNVPAGTIDWVLVEIRTNGRARVDSATTVAALLMEDGSIRATDGVSLPAAVVLVAGSHYVVVRHRNHMPVMSDGFVDFDGSSPTQYDFTTASTQAYGANSMKALGSDWGMFAGDANGENGITASDIAFFTSQNGGPAGYNEADFNLTGSVTASDNALWVNNNGIASPVPGN
jgi:hypothetical protein